MKIIALLAAAALTLGGCAGISSAVPDQNRPVAQLSEEAGKLPVGKVLSVGKVWFQRESEAPTPVYVNPSLAAAASAAMPLFEAIRNTDWLFRHSIRMKTGETVSIDLRYEFKVGDCVAFRAGLQEETELRSRAAISALRQECEGA